MENIKELDGGYNTYYQAYDHEKRLYHDTTTWMAEVLEGQMRTTFEYSFDGRELYGQDGSCVGEIFKDALEEARHLPPELGFEQRRRLHELDEYREMKYMMSDGSDYDTMVVVSDFPQELTGVSEDVGGYNVSRKQTMLRVLYKTPEGALKMSSQSLDKSDRASLEAIYGVLGFEPQPGELLGQRMHLQLGSEPDQEFLVDHLAGTYDRSLSEKHGGSWTFGRPSPRGVNTYDFVCSQQDLLSLYMENAEKFGDNQQFLLNVVAKMEERWQGQAVNPGAGIAVAPPIESYWLRQQLLEDVQQAGQKAILSGKRYSGCGLSLSGYEDSDTQDELSEVGFGNKSQEDKYGSLTFKCSKGHTNKRPRNQLIEKCKICSTSVRC